MSTRTFDEQSRVWREQGSDQTYRREHDCYSIQDIYQASRYEASLMSRVNAAPPDSDQRERAEEALSSYDGRYDDDDWGADADDGGDEWPEEAYDDDDGSTHLDGEAE